MRNVKVYYSCTLLVSVVAHWTSDLYLRAVVGSFVRLLFRSNDYRAGTATPQDIGVVKRMVTCIVGRTLSMLTVLTAAGAVSRGTLRSSETSPRTTIPLQTTDDQDNYFHFPEMKDSLAQLSHNLQVSKICCHEARVSILGYSDLVLHIMDIGLYRNP